jgi:AcrR family transcriptional regulator
MKWGRRAGPRGYHHGNLKEALVRAALELIAEKGPAGFTFADAARWAGVSPAAPYRHFRDRDALLADVARRGFQEFASALAKAWDEGKPEVMAAFDRLICRVARGGRETGFVDSVARASAGSDGRIAHMVDDARDRLVVRPRRRGPSRITDAARGTAGSCRPHLPARSGA